MFHWINKIIDLTESLESKAALNIISRQLIRSATSVGANYRASDRAKSLADKINILNIREKRLKKEYMWLELLQYGINKKLVFEMDEAKAFLAIIVSSIKTLRKIVILK